MGRKVPVYDRGATAMRIFDVQMLYADVMDQYLVITTMEEQQQQMEESRKADERRDEAWEAKEEQVKQGLLSSSTRGNISLISNRFEDGEDETHFSDEEMFAHNDPQLKTTHGGTRRAKSPQVDKFPVVKHTKKSALCNKKHCYMMAATSGNEPMIIDLRAQTNAKSGCDRLLCESHMRNVTLDNCD
jgi:hypothetical protein